HRTEVVDGELAPMPFDQVLSSPVRLHPLATDAATGESCDLAPYVVDATTLKLALRATTALPLLSGRPVALGGRLWFDAGLAEAVPPSIGRLERDNELVLAGLAAGRVAVDRLLS